MYHAVWVLVRAEAALCDAGALAPLTTCAWVKLVI